MDADIPHIVMVSIVFQEKEGCHVVGATKYGPNVVILIITVVWKRWYFFRAYVPPNDQLSVYWVEQDLDQGLAGTETLLVRNLNTRLMQPHNQH